MSPTANASNSAEEAIQPAHNRVFAALPVPLNIQAELHDKAREQIALPDLHWTPTANYHITLAFMGDLHSSQLKNLCAALTVLEPLPAVAIRLRSIALFPDSSGHIVAAMAHKTQALTGLHETIIQAATASGIPLHREQFLPHITLARQGKSARHQETNHSSFGAVSLSHLDEFEVRSFALYRGVRETAPDNRASYHYRAITTFALATAERNQPEPGL